MLPLDQSAVAVALLGSASFLLVGLLSGVWKYACIARSADATAPVYVDICHRASLLYSFASLVITVLAAHSAWSNGINLLAVIALQAYFAAAVLGYAVHGVLRDTDNQLRKPYTLGRSTVSGTALHGFMVSLCVAEIGGFLVLFAGLIRTLQTMS